MATIREQIAHSTSAETTRPQRIPDDPLAPTPLHFTDWRDADGGLYQQTVNRPSAGWHLEDDAEASDAEPSPHRGQGYPPSRQTRDYRQQAQTTQAYPPDYEDAATTYTTQARAPRSAMRYQQTLPGQYRGQVVLPAPPQQLRRQRLTGEAPAPHKQRRSRLWSLYLVTGMLATAALVAGLNSPGSWWQHVQEDWAYGMPRTYQTDAVVGHNHDSSGHPSHFLAINLHGQVEVFELPAGDPTKVRVFLGPLLSGNDADQVVVSISFADLDHDGTPDLILRYGDSAEVFSNKGGTFQLSGGKA